MILAAENLEYGYGHGRTIFAGISLNIRKGEIFTILGANGAGKSTLLNCIANQLKPTSGRVTIDGVEISSFTRPEFAKRVGYVAQFHLPVFDYTVEELVVMGRTPHLGIMGEPAARDFEIAYEMMELMGVAHLAKRSYLQISGGERQLALFAQALTLQPDFLILDEPTSHLDFGNQLRCLHIVESVASQGYGVILTSHFPDHSLMFGHKVGILHDGNFIAVGQADEVVTAENMKRIYNVDTEIGWNESVKRTTCLAK